MPTMSDEELASMASVAVVHHIAEAIDPDTGLPCDELRFACAKKTRTLEPDEDGTPLDSVVWQDLAPDLLTVLWTRGLDGLAAGREPDYLKVQSDKSVLARWVTNRIARGEPITIAFNFAFTDDNPAGGTVVRTIDHYEFTCLPRL